jgi:hypothetical protein
MRNFYEYGSNVVCVETCCPGHGPMLLGLGATQSEAIDALESTPIAGHLEPRKAIEWAVSEGWWSGDEAAEIVDAEIDAA